MRHLRFNTLTVLNIDFYKDLKLTKTADQKHKKLENDVLVQSDIVLTIGKQLSKELKTLGAKRVEIIENGFDPQDFLDDANHELDEKFSIAHIGSFTPSRNHTVLWKALSHLVDEQEEFKSKLEIKLIGKVEVVQNIQKEFSKILILFLKFLAKSQISFILAISPSIEKTPSVTIILCLSD